jgi:hypothetical protein
MRGHCTTIMSDQDAALAGGNFKYDVIWNASSALSAAEAKSIAGSRRRTTTTIR